MLKAYRLKAVGLDRVMETKSSSVSSMSVQKKRHSHGLGTAPLSAYLIAMNVLQGLVKVTP
jgi:hypothetical protein